MPTATRPSLSTTAPMATPIHPGWVRATHWLNAAAVALLVGSGWRIYNAAPLFDFRFPAGATLGGWLGGALQWHFAAMWLLAGNGLVYLLLNLVSGRWRRKFLPLTPALVRADLVAALRGRLRHADPRHYNGVQRLAYLGTVAALVLLVLSGLVLWKSVQFALLREMLGGYEGARLVHFAAMSAVVAFIVVHLAMVAVVPSSLRAMLRGQQERP
jgi:thiosulfate reductase cytochrome b subunit